MIYSDVLNNTIVICTPNIKKKDYDFEGTEEYKYATLKYSVKSGAMWTISEKFKDMYFSNLDPISKLLIEKYGKAINRNNKFDIEIKPHRA